MCLAIPCKIVELEENGNNGIVEIEGVKKKVSLVLLENPKIGEYVIIHAGYAINKLNEDEAKETLKLFDEMALLALRSKA